MTEDKAPETDTTEDPSVDPFDCLPPTRRNFSSAAHALVYYEARLAKARKAERLLHHGSTLARTVVERAQCAADQVRSLSVDQLRKLGLSPEAIAELRSVTDAPDQLGAAIVPMVTAFAKAAELFGERAKLLESTCTALIAQAERDKQVVS